MGINVVGCVQGLTVVLRSALWQQFINVQFVVYVFSRDQTDFEERDVTSG